MKLYRATGYCSECQKFVKLEGISDAEDVEQMFYQEHRADEGHWFEGSVEVSSYEQEVKVGKKFKGLRR